MNITSKKENALLERMEVQGTIEFEGATPSVAHVTQELAQQLHHDPANVAVQHIYTQFGHHRAEFIALVYASAQARKKVEVLHPHMKKKEGEKKTEEKKAVKKKEGA
ncbi:MAG TPA: hypothetical protein VJI32_04270 [Candidatus Nanoarchaeia archaeon]|nr:hypothetical protein [Candidatus Nanoarchaeia archaeon]